ncbi:Thioredoxin domain-containing protein [Spironucleus salmonicida]|uniref:Thioredoxin domain-containing protein n=1 Tax=Spironucleus salmonicida TaxID=348837 RepID=V6LQT7_9EUKA|nr:Thioredoxin domain-containing protein [Spironucleus salmonicida]|eukprot:EST46613.1 Thioredoxin domain-containing protein [Spironucleus salmonicida]
MSDTESDIEISNDNVNDQLEGYMRARREQLKQEFKNQELKFQGFGKLDEIDETVFLANVTAHDYVIAHFYQPEFITCQAMNVILEEMAQQHLESKFIKIDAPGAGFFVNKLKIKTLPTIIIFKKGKILKKFIGFEEFGMDQPSYDLVLKGLGTYGALTLSLQEEKQFKKSGGTLFGYADEEGSDW